MVPAALPFWLPLTLLIPLGIGAGLGGWWMLTIPIYAWIVISVLDQIIGLNEDNPDPNATDSLFWHKLVTWVWAPLQPVVIFTCLWIASRTMGTGEAFGLMAACGVLTGTIGINFAHELIHRPGRIESSLGDLLLVSVLYGHFRSEHVLVHHRYVGTPRDPVTARYNEGFWRFFPRVLWQQVASAWAVEAERLRRKDRPFWHRANPFWIYFGGGLAFLAVAWLLAGWFGMALFVTQAFVAILHLELVNYVEHYGLTRKHLGDGKYEHVKPRHSWNASHRWTNWLLINLQRHSDHHYKPDRRFPLLQTYTEEEAPQLPFGYPLMILIAGNPLLWRRMMNPRVRAWRQRFYPEIEDWTPYKTGMLPVPR
ncbi:MAG: alkane 1-monooxygenase [Rubricella sp.]